MGKATPPLENGDRLNSIEFERRTATIPEQIKTELIDGVVYMASALRYAGHGLPHSHIMTWLGFYMANTPGVELADNTTVRLDIDNQPQPDALLRIKKGGQSRVSRDDYISHIMTWLGFYMANTPGVELADNTTVRLDIDNQPQPDALLRIKKGGQSRVSRDDYIEGAPELVVEIAGSSASYDLYDKRQVYRRHGVKEYIVWQVYEKKIDWFYLSEGRYVTFEPDGSGLIESQVFPGLVLAINSLLEYNLAEVLDILQQHLNTHKHLAFLKTLAL